jgi:IMP dehydrogenase
MGYSGTKTVEQLRDRAQFIRVTAMAHQESHPHDLSGVIDAPNYWASER